MSKTESFIRHLAHHKLGEHKGSRRVWLEGRRLADAGFKQGVRYSVGATTDGQLRLRLLANGTHVVSHKQGRPVVDLLTRALGDVERVEVRFGRREVLISVLPLDRQAAARLVRLNARIQGGQTIRLGSLSHGGGVASDALLRGLGAAGLDAKLAFGLDIEGRYIEQSLHHGPLARGGMSIEADLGDIDADLLPEVDVLEAGLPCVSASRAGRAKKGLERPEADPQTADLAAAFLDVIRATQPAVIILENVPEYADSASADMIRRRLGRWGYVIHEHTVDGAEWSLEARSRWAMVAVTRGLNVDLSALVASGERPATLGEVLDQRTPAAAWRTTEGKDRKQAADKAKGNRFQQRFLTPASTSVPTLRRGYIKNGSTDPRLRHPSRPGLSRLLSPAEHARIKGVPPVLIKGASDTMAHEILGQSVISPAFAALGQLVGAAIA